MDKDMLKFLIINSNKILKYIVGLFSPGIILIIACDLSAFYNLDILKLIILSVAISSCTYICVCGLECIDVRMDFERKGVNTVGGIISVLMGKIQIEVEPKTVDSASDVASELLEKVGERTLIYNFAILSFASLMSFFVTDIKRNQVVILILSEIVFLYIIKSIQYWMVKVTHRKQR